VAHRRGSDPSSRGQASVGLVPRILLSRFVDWNPVRRSRRPATNGREVTMTDRVTTIRDELTPMWRASTSPSTTSPHGWGPPHPRGAPRPCRQRARCGSRRARDRDAHDLGLPSTRWIPSTGVTSSRWSSPGWSARCARRHISLVPSVRSSPARPATPRATWPGCAESWPPPTATRSPSPRMQAPRMRADPHGCARRRRRGAHRVRVGTAPKPGKGSRPGRKKEVAAQ